MKSIKVFEHEGAGSDTRRAMWADLKLPIEWIHSVEAGSTKDSVEILTGWDSEDYLLRLKNVPREVLLIRHLDVIDHTGGKVWPRSLLSLAIRQIVLRSSRGLDLRAWALVTGTSPLSRAALLSAFEVGYRMVRLVHADGEEAAAEKIRADFEKFCFGLKIQPQKRAELTLQPNNGALLINVEDLALDEDLLQTLLYLNFLHRPGLVLDFSSQPGSESALLREARLSDFETVSGFRVRTEWDFIFLQSLKLAPGLNAEEYHARASEIRGTTAAE